MYGSSQPKSQISEMNLLARTKGKKNGPGSPERRLGGLRGRRSRICKRRRPKAPRYQAAGSRRHVTSSCGASDTAEEASSEAETDIPDSESDTPTDVIPCTQDAPSLVSVDCEKHHEEESNLGRLVDVYSTVE
ncbi:hypothetical protein CEP54_016183, partial [Fusarium duplospermum]